MTVPNTASPHPAPPPPKTVASKSLTPMLRHFLEVKAAYPDCFILYRMGDFFELFFDDAVQAAPILEVTLTARHKGGASEVAMCGVPHHALDSYVGKLLAAGYKAAICDQVEDPSEAKGLVKREVTRVMTPGTVSEPALLDSKEENFLVAVLWDDSSSPDGTGAGAFLEVSTGHFYVRRWRTPGEAIEDLRLQRVREVLFGRGLPSDLVAVLEREIPCRTPLDTSPDGDRLFDPRRANEELKSQLGVSSLRGFGLQDDELAVRAAVAALAYARETQHNELAHIRRLSVREPGDALVLDATTVANLEIFRSLREGGRKGTLLSVLDRTATAPGGRTLRDWLRRPLRRRDAIAERHAAVRALVHDGEARDDLRERLGRVSDPERLLTRAVLGSLSPREAAALRDSLAEVPAILGRLFGVAAGESGLGQTDALGSSSGSTLLAELAAVDPLADLQAELARVLEAEPAAKLEKGGVIAASVDEDLDRFRSLARGSKQHILQLEASEREKTGISSLKIRYNRVFGYYLEVTKANQHLVPEHYIRKQTLVNAERYITPEVKELEEEILEAEERQLALEAEYYQRLVATVAEHGPGLSALASALGRLDVLLAFADVAARQRYVEPEMGELGGPIDIREGRHPVVERSSSDPFVPNDVQLDANARIVLLTGPNMGGKSTYLRQVALIVLMAQAGSFVPADAAKIGVVDRIFTRVGASDDLARGESTFMVEMIETANILHHATEHSLVILDEVGRGTATFDGLSLAWAIVEHLHEHRRPKTLFATHYHELTELATLLPGLVNRTLAVKEWNDQIHFLRRVIDGSADKSYGIQVARLAGLPGSVIERASEVLSNLESQEYDLTGKPRLARGNAPESVLQAAAEPKAQMTLFAPPEEVVAKILRQTDVEQLTPLAALNLLHSLKERL